MSTISSSLKHTHTHQTDEHKTCELKNKVHDKKI